MASGFLSYYEVCDFLHEPNTTLVWDNEQQVPFAYRGNQWVGFDDERSLRTKVNWLKTEGFGGIMVWSGITTIPHFIIFALRLETCNLKTTKDALASAFQRF